MQSRDEYEKLNRGTALSVENSYLSIVLYGILKVLWNSLCSPPVNLQIILSTHLQTSSRHDNLDNWTTSRNSLQIFNVFQEKQCSGRRIVSYHFLDRVLTFLNSISFKSKTMLVSTGYSRQPQNYRLNRWQQFMKLCYAARLPIKVVRSWQNTMDAISSIRCSKFLFNVFEWLSISKQNDFAGLL